MHTDVFGALYDLHYEVGIETGHDRVYDRAENHTYLRFKSARCKVERKNKYKYD